MQVTNGKGETAKVLFTQETTRPAKGRWGKPGGGKTEKTDLMDEAPESAPGDAPESGANDAPESGAAEAAAPAPKRRGRPPGSKNRKKPAIAPAA